jgi:hypothetical protein
MLRFLFTLVLLGGIAAAVALAPLRGKTVLQRWNAAPTAAEFTARGWQECKVALGLEPERARARPPRAEAQRPARPSAPRAPHRPAQPTEEHTDRDRAALERVLAERAP